MIRAVKKVQGIMEWTVTRTEVLLKRGGTNGIFLELTFEQMARAENFLAERVALVMKASPGRR